MTERSGHAPHAPRIVITGSVPADIHVTVDGEPFPWPIYNIEWAVAASNPQIPALTFTVEVSELTISQSFDYTELEEEDA